MSLGFGFLALTAMLAPPPLAAEAAERGSPILREVTACRSIADPAARLACYDTSVGRISDAQAKGDIVVLDRDEVRRTRRSLFGFSLPRIPFFGSGDGEEDRIKEIDATIARVVPWGHRRWTLHLSDGSVWQTLELIRLNDPEKGDSIKIRAAALGSYRAEINGGTPVRVQRVG